MRGHLCPVVAKDHGVGEFPPFPRGPFSFSAGKETNISSSHLALTHQGHSLYTPAQLPRLSSHFSVPRVPVLTTPPQRQYFQEELGRPWYPSETIPCLISAWGEDPQRRGVWRAGARGSADPPLLRLQRKNFHPECYSKGQTGWLPSSHIL